MFRCPSSIHHFQRSSSPKPLGQSKPNFIWSLTWMGERKFVRRVWVTWQRWPPCPYMIKNLQKSSSPEPKGQWPCVLVCSIGVSGPSYFVQMMTLGWPWLILRQGQIYSLMLLYGEKLLESHLIFETYSKWPEWQKIYVYIKILTPRGLSAPALGLYTCIKTGKNMYKIRLKDIFLKLATNGQSDKAFLLTSGFCPQRVVCPCPQGYIHVEKH